MNKLWWSGVGIILIIGIILSLRDYRAWHNAETANYGHGSPAETGFAPAQSLGLPFESSLWRFRIKYPLNWKMITDTQSVVKFIDPSGQAQIVISGQLAKADLTTEANKLAAGITDDRQYLTANGAEMTVLTWEGPKEVVQKAATIHQGNLLVITTVCPTSAWKTFAKTFLSVYQSWTPI